MPLRHMVLVIIFFLTTRVHILYMDTTKSELPFFPQFQKAQGTHFCSWVSGAHPARLKPPIPELGLWVNKSYFSQKNLKNDKCT